MISSNFRNTGYLFIAAVAALCCAVGLPGKAMAKSNKFVTAYQAAAAGKDGVFILSRVAKGFRWERDFGGGFRAQMSAATNFSDALSLDNSRLRPDAKDVGWKRLAEILAQPLKPNAKRPGEMCTTPKVTKDGIPSDRICFAKIGGDWLITAYIGGGD